MCFVAAGALMLMFAGVVGSDKVLLAVGVVCLIVSSIPVKYERRGL